MNIDFDKLDWEADKDIRRAAVLALDEGELGTENKQNWLKLLDLRYVEKKKLSADLFVRFWLDMFYYGEFTKTAMEVHRAKKDIGAFLENQNYLDIYGHCDECKEILHHELINALIIYFKSCLTDRSYASSIFGLKRLSTEQVFDKMERQTNNVSHLLPERLNMVQELQWVCALTEETFVRFRQRAQVAMEFM